MDFEQGNIDVDVLYMDVDLSPMTADC